MTDYHVNALTAALRRLGDTALVQALARRLDAEAAALSADLNRSLLAEIAAFSESGNPQVLPGLARHAGEHTAELLRLLRGGRVGSFEFVREYVQRHAEQRFPLEAVLHAYRCAHKLYSRWLREAALAALPAGEPAQAAVAAVADLAMEYTDAVSTTAAAAYSAHSRLLAEVAGDQRAQLLGILLEGYDEADARAAGLLRRGGFLDQRRAFCVVLAQSVEPAEMLNPARARRLAEAVDGACRASRWRRLVDLRDKRVVAVLSDTRRASGWTPPQSALAGRAAQALQALGPAVLVGLSNDAPSTAHIPKAYREALLALELASVDRRVLQFSDIPPPDLLLHLAGEELRKVLPAWAEALHRADTEMRGTLVQTLRAYADADMNLLKSAQALRVHPNTVYHRLRRVRELTGRDARSFHALSELLIAAHCQRR